MRRNTINNKITNVTLALLVSTAYVTSAMEGDDGQLAEEKGHPNQSRNFDYAPEEAKGTGTLQAQIRAKVAMILKGFEDSMNAYYEQTGNPKRISIAPELIDTQEKQHEQFEDGAADYCEARLQETGVKYKSTLTEIKWALKHYPFTEATGAVATMLLETMEKEIAPKLEAQAKAEETQGEMLNNVQQPQAEKITKQTAQERLEAEKAKAELCRQEQLRKAEEARQQLAQRKEKAEPAKSEMLSKNQQSQPENAKKQTAQERLEAEKVKVELRRQEQQRKAEEARQQLAQRKAKVEAAKTEMLNKSQHEQPENVQKQTAQERLEAEKAKVEMCRQEQQRKAEDARRQLAQRKAEAEANKVGMRKQEQQYKVDNIQEQEGQ